MLNGVINPIWDETRAQEGHTTVLTQVTTSKFMDFYALAKNSPVNSKKYAALLSVLIKQFENGLQDCKSKPNQVLLFETIFKQHKKITCKFSNGMYRVEI